MDNDFPATLGGGSSTSFLKGYTSRVFGGSVNNTQLPTTGEYAAIQQTMRDGQYSPMAVDYGKFGSAPYNVAGNPFGPDFEVRGTSPNTGDPTVMPGENLDEIRRVYGTRIKGKAIDIGPGFTGLQLPPV